MRGEADDRSASRGARGSARIALAGGSAPVELRPRSSGRGRSGRPSPRRPTSPSSASSTLSRRASSASRASPTVGRIVLDQRSPDGRAARPPAASGDSAFVSTAAVVYGVRTGAASDPDAAVAVKDSRHQFDPDAARKNDRCLGIRSGSKRHEFLSVIDLTGAMPILIDDRDLHDPGSRKRVRSMPRSRMGAVR